MSILLTLVPRPACLAFVNGAAQKFGRLDILINNAGILKYEKVDEASTASWNEILNVNLMSYIKGHLRRYGVRLLNHGIGFPTAAIELLLPTYSERLGLKGRWPPIGRGTRII